MEDAGSIAHGCTGKGNDQVRLDVSVRALDPEPQGDRAGPRVGHDAARRDRVRARPGTFRCRRPSTARTAPTRTCGDGPSSAACSRTRGASRPRTIYTLTRSPADSPDAPAYVEIEFAAGVPTQINGVAMPLVELIGSLETIAGAHGVGRIDMVENRLVGIKSREIYEAPAAVVLHAAHRELEGLVIPKDLQRLKRALAGRTRTSCTTGCGSRRCARRSTRSSARCRSG